MSHQRIKSLKSDIDDHGSVQLSAITSSSILIDSEDKVYPSVVQSNFYSIVHPYHIRNVESLIN